MKPYVTADNAVERRAASRSEIGRYYEVSFLSGGPEGTYRLKILNRSSNSLGLLVVQDDSDILSSIQVGDRLELVYNQLQTSSYYVHQRSVVRHITKKYHAPRHKCYIIGLETLPRQKTKS
jgi:hypothetical protein